jgi:hypothetical protein
LGCNDTNRTAPINRKGLNAYQVWNYYALHGTDDLNFSPNYWRLEAGKDPVPILRPLAGYNVTKHFAEYHSNSSTFTPFTIDSCENIPVSRYTITL